MYEKLIKSLRVEPFEVESVGLAKTMNEAADAIEELSKRVPPVPHGRLIDADALAERFWDGQCYFTEAIKSKLQTAPTIIEADG